MGTRRWRRRALGAVLALGATWWLCGFVVVWRLTRRAMPPRPEPLPAVPWGSFEEHRLTTADGEQIGAWLLAGEPTQPAVVLLHGNGGSRSHVLARVRPLAERGLTVLALSLRAHGDSSGERNDFGWGARHDVAAAVRFLSARGGERPIVLHGVSLGAAAAIFAVDEVGGVVDGYVLECPYRDLGSASWNRIRWFLSAPLDSIAWWALRAAAPLLIESEAVRPLEVIERIPSGVPVLILAGAKDRHATPQEAGALFDRLGAAARLVVVPGADHDRLRQTDPELYWREIDALLGAVRHAHSPTGSR